jgi:integrase
MVKAGYSPSYIRGAYAILSGILRGAVAAGMLAKAPLDRVELPEMRRKRERFLTVAEIDGLVSHFAPRHRVLVYTAAWTGLRWGEIVGLRQDALDLEAGQLHVRTVLTHVRESGQMVYGLKPYPKSDAGLRTIGLDQRLARILSDHVETMEGSDLVFPASDGGFLRDSNFRRRQWNPAVAEAHLAPLTFHDLRHTHVAHLIAYGWQEYRIVRRLGWRDATMLHRVYGHLFPRHDEELLADLEQRRQAAVDTAAILTSLR